MIGTARSIFALPAIDLYMVYYLPAFVLLRQFLTCPGGSHQMFMVEMPLLRPINQTQQQLRQSFKSDSITVNEQGVAILF